MDNRCAPLWTALVAVLAIGCSTAGPTAPTSPPGSPSESTPAARCTLDTPLEPGVPGSPGHLVTSTVNPNGDSELALLMRAMTADLEAAGAAVANQRPVPAPSVDHAKLRCAWPTDLATRNPMYDAFAQAYLRAWDELQREPPAARPLNAVVDACVGCHESFCQGPVERISALRLAP